MRLTNWAKTSLFSFHFPLPPSPHRSRWVRDKLFQKWDLAEGIYTETSMNNSEAKEHFWKKREWQ